MDTIKTTDKGDEIIVLIQFIVDDRNRMIEKLRWIDEHESHKGSLTFVESYLRDRYRYLLVRCDEHIKNLRDALHREHFSVMEALGL